MTSLKYKHGSFLRLQWKKAPWHIQESNWSSREGRICSGSRGKRCRNLSHKVSSRSSHEVGRTRTGQAKPRLQPPLWSLAKQWTELFRLTWGFPCNLISVLATRQQWLFWDLLDHPVLLSTPSPSIFLGGSVLFPKPFFLWGLGGKGNESALSPMWRERQFDGCSLAHSSSFLYHFLSIRTHLHSSCTHQAQFNCIQYKCSKV